MGDKLVETLRKALNNSEDSDDDLMKSIKDTILGKRYWIQLNKIRDLENINDDSKGKN